MGLPKNQQKLLDLLKEISVEMIPVTEKGFTEFTGKIGELEICKQFGYTWYPTEGYDAWDGQNKKKIQIKTRRLHSSPNFEKGRINVFGRKNKYKFDNGFLVQLDEEFEMFRVWNLDKDSIENLEKKEKSGVGLHVSTFLKYSEQIFPKT